MMTKKSRKRVVKYIKRCYKSGISIDEILRVLRYAGWSKEELDVCLHDAVLEMKRENKAKQSLLKKIFKKAKHIFNKLFYNKNSNVKNVNNKKILKKKVSKKQKEAGLPILYKDKHPNISFKKSKSLILINSKKEKHLKKVPKKRNKKTFNFHKLFESFYKKYTSELEKISFDVFILFRWVKIVLLYILKIFITLIDEIILLFKSDIAYIKKESRLFAREVIDDVEVLKKEPKYIKEKAISLWFFCEYFIEKWFSFLEKISYSILRLLMLPFVLFFGTLVRVFPFIKKAFKEFRPKIGIVEDKEYTIKEVAKMKFPERILLVDILRLAKRMFETRRLRTFLTILGMGVGTGTILFLVSLGYGLQNVLFERITSEDALLTIDAYPPPSDVGIKIDDEMIKNIENIPEVLRVGKVVGVSDVSLDFKDTSVVSTMNIADKNYRAFSGERFVVGSFKKDGIVISSAIVQILQVKNPKQLIGQEVSISNIVLPDPKNEGFFVTYNLDEKYKITGIVDNDSESYFYFPKERLRTDIILPSYTHIKIKAKDADLVGVVKNKVVDYGLQVAALSDTLEQAKKIFSIARIILALFGVITLVVSAIGMLNTMTIALLERTQEVGIMKAIGASNKDIWKLFLAESVIMGFLGGIGGIVIGYIASEAFNYGINLLARVFGGQALDLFQQPLWFVVTIVIFSSVVGFITGLMPARRAAKLDPLIALRKG